MHNTDAASSEIKPAVSAGAPPRKVSESLFDSSGALLDHATQLGKSSVRTTSPLTSSTGAGGEASAPAVSQGVVQRQPPKDSLPNNPIGHDVGVQWQQQQQPPS